MSTSLPMLREQTFALIGLRWTVWRRRVGGAGKFGRFIFGGLSLLGGLAITGLASVGIFFFGREMAGSPKALPPYGGSIALMGLILSAMLGARLYLSILSVATGVPFLHPRRFLVFAVPPALITAINCIAQLFEPAWIVFYAPSITLAWSFSELPFAPSFGPMLLGLFFLYLCAAAVLQLLIALVGELFAHKATRRIASLGLLVFAWGISVAFSRAAHAHSVITPAHLWSIAKLLPPGWAVLLAVALTQGRFIAALGYALALVSVGLLAAIAGHKLSLREARRPPETTLASETTSGPSGWRIPFLPGPISALIEKETKTIFRAMWLQMIAGPVGFLIMRFLLLQGRSSNAGGPFLGPQPLLLGAVYAHLGVLAVSVNAFGLDGSATRGLFLWPLRGRTVLAAKNAVAYFISLGIFILLALISRFAAPLTLEQFVVGFCAHAATFPVLASLGNATSIYFPSPMKGGKLQRQPGGMTAMARISALALIALTGWAPYALAKLLGLPLIAAYLGELVTMAVAYGGVLSFSEQLLEGRREKLLGALAKDE